MDALQTTSKLPSVYPELGSLSTSSGFPSHHFASLHPPLLPKDSTYSISVGGPIYSPAIIPLPGVHIPNEWFEPKKYADSAIHSARIHDSTSRNKLFEDVSVSYYAALNHNIQGTSRNGLFEEGSVRNYTTSDNNKLNERLKTVSIQKEWHADALPRESELVPVETFYFLLHRCTMEKDILAGRLIHLQIISSGLDFVPELGVKLIRLFFLCASLDEADLVFCKLAVPGVSAWYAIISAHATHGENDKAVQLYTSMVNAGIAPNSFIFTGALKSCTNSRALTKGESIHNDIIFFGLQFDLFVASALIDFYSKCGSFSKAYKVFVMLPIKNVVAWTSIIDAFILVGRLEESFELLKEMQGQDVEPNEFTYSTLISACGNAGYLVQGMLLHDQFMKSGLELDSRMASTLIDMYAKCGCLIEAREVFDDLPNRTLVCWNTIIAGYARNQHDRTALQVFDSMKSEGYKPNSSTISCCFKACGNLKDIEQGRAIHDQIMMTGLDPDEYIQSSLIDMYCKCGCLNEAQHVFDHWPSRDIISWGALMAGYVQHDRCLSALEFFAKMQKDGIKSNVHIYSSALKACGILAALKTGIDLHHQIHDSGLEICVVLGSSLIDMYAKCGDLEAALKVFEELPFQNIVCWGAIIAGYVQHGHPLPAFGLYEKMVSEGMRPDRVIYMYVLEACAIMGSSGHGKAIHDQIIASGLGSDEVVGNSLVDMYIKCDCLQEAQSAFQALQQRTKIAWDAMVVAYTKNNNFAMARNCLKGMAEEGFLADEILFTDILAACRRNGNIREGWKFFQLMRGVYGINPSIEHFGCMVNLLGEGGYLSEAEELLDTLPMPPDSVAWLSLLAACRAHGKVDLGFKCFSEVVRLDPGMGMAYVLMSSVFAEAGLWDKKHMIDEQRKEADIWKIPGRAWIEVNKEVHEFTVGDRTHPHSNKIYATLRRLAVILKDEGHVPQLGVVGRAVPDNDGAKVAENNNEDALLGHCEKLAIAFGLCSTPEGATVRVVKNLRVCVDCHSASKVISRVERREIIINDAYHVHHFNNGECSCEKNLVSG